LAANKRQNLRRQVRHEPVKCVVCGEMFEPRRADAKTCSKAHRQKLYREISKQRAREQTETPSVKLGEV
jgi:tRNA A37 threonylcarbamoyladenosine dehydratase